MDRRGSVRRWRGGRAAVLIVTGVLAWGFIQPGTLSPLGWAVAAVAALVILPRAASDALADQDAKAYRQMVEGWRAQGAGGPGDDEFEIAVLDEMRHPTSRDERASGLIQRWSAEGRWSEIEPVLSRATWDFRRCVGSCLDGAVDDPTLPRLARWELFKVRAAAVAPAQPVRAQLVLATAVAVLDGRGRHQASANLSRPWSAAGATVAMGSAPAGDMPRS